MEVEHPLLAEKSIFAKPNIAQSQTKASDEVITPLSKTSISEASHDFCNHSESFKKLVEMSLPCNEPVEKKLSWLRTQIVGNNAEFDSPFGRQKIVYADHTASGRSLSCNENFIIKHLLPFYGMLMTSCLHPLYFHNHSYMF